MKYYDRIKEQGLSYEVAVAESKIIQNEGFITRPDWDGVHFMFNDDYFILLKTGELVANPEEIHNINDNDWMIVTVSNETQGLINKLLTKYYRGV